MSRVKRSSLSYLIRVTKANFKTPALAKDAATSALQELNSGKAFKEVAEKASPAFANTHPDTSFLLLHGTEDTIVPAEESKEFAEKLRKEGIKVTYVTFEKAGHAFLGTGNEADKKAALVILEWIANLVQ